MNPRERLLRDEETGELFTTQQPAQSPLYYETGTRFYRIRSEGVTRLVPATSENDLPKDDPGPRGHVVLVRNRRANEKGQPTVQLIGEDYRQRAVAGSLAAATRQAEEYAREYPGTRYYIARLHQAIEVTPKLRSRGL